MLFMRKTERDNRKFIGFLYFENTEDINQFIYIALYLVAT